MIKDGTKHLGQYRLDSELGSGGMGIVYRATDETLHREIAIKVLHPHLLQNEDLKERFRREARMHAQLMHPNVVTLLSLYEDSENMALIMEMVHGKNLREYLRAAKKHPIIDLLRIGQSILSGLKAAHQIGLVHRDLKPANVLLSDNGDVKLMDFGLAKPAAGDDDLTQSGATVGSFRYMAPEQILNSPIDARTDLYAFGILLYQMMTGKLPFDASAQGGGEFEIMEKQVREQPISPHELNSALALEISDLILRLLAKNPDDRPSSCEDVYQEIDMIARNLSGNAMAPGLARGTASVSQHSNASIAKGLLKASVHHAMGWFSTLANVVVSRLPHWEKPTKPTLKRVATWGGLGLILIVLGWALVSVMGIAERPLVLPLHQQATPKVLPTVPDTQESNQVVLQKELKKEPKKVAHVLDTIQKPEIIEKSVVKTVAKSKKLSKVKKVRKPRAVQRSITYSVKYKVQRPDGRRVDTSKPHEFRGGSHLYFKSLEAYRGKGLFTAYKEARLRLYLDEPVAVRKIILHKASIGKLSFKGGYVRLSVQDEKRKWHKVFNRQDDDVDIAVTIRASKLPKKIIGVRLRFRSPEPITVGPIDLLR